MPAEGGCSSDHTVTPVGTGAASGQMHSQLQGGCCDGSPEGNEECKEGESFMVGGGCFKYAL